MELKPLNWYLSTLLVIPLIFLTYYILSQNLLEDRAFGITGVLILFSFSQFFFQRRNLNYTIKTLIWFYIFGVLSSIFISYTYFYTQYDWLAWLILFQIFIFYIIIVNTSILTNQGEVDSNFIEVENENKKWYQRILTSKTQQKKNKEFILDFLIFIVFIIVILLIKDKIF